MKWVTMLMEFKDRIKKRRLEIGATLEDVGKIVGVSKATVLRWESGEIENVRLDKIEALAKALKISPAYIMGWEDEPETQKAPPENPNGAMEDAMRKAFLEGASRLSEGRKIQLLEFLRFQLAQEEAEALHKEATPEDKQ